MTDYEKYQYALSRLHLAQLMNDEPEIKTWQDHVIYWETILNINERLRA